jgi:hypothetical protein
MDQCAHAPMPILPSNPLEILLYLAAGQPQHPGLP